jgi:hypothetical protein
MGLDEIAEAAAGIPGNHPANLLAAFPMPYGLDRYLFVGSVLGITLTAVLFVASLRDAKKFRQTQIESELRRSGQRKLVASLEHNRGEMDALRAQIPDEPNVFVTDVHLETISLAAAIPDALLLQSLKLSDNGDFEIEALTVGSGFDPKTTRTALSDYGFIPDSSKGWVYDAASGKVNVRGKYGIHTP